MTLDETADFISEGLESWQRDENLKFLKNVHITLANNGVWGSPSMGLAFKRTDEGFELLGAVIPPQLIDSL